MTPGRLPTDSAQIRAGKVAKFGKMIEPMTISVRQVMVLGESRWSVDARSIGKGRQIFDSERDARRVAAEMRSEVAGGWDVLTERERREYGTIHRELASEGLTIADVLGQWRAGVRAVTALPRITLGDACARCVADKTASGRRPLYLASLSGYLDRFARGREAMQLSAIQQPEIRAWLDQSGNLASRATIISRLGTLFAWAVRAGFLSSNPMERVERVTVESRPPRILSVKECAKLLDLVTAHHPRALGWFSLCLFAGVRPQEAGRLTWAAVDLDRGIVTVDAAASKVRFRRIVTLLPCARAWLTEARRIGSDMPMPHASRRRAVRAVRDAMGWPSWPADILRHTAASYWLAHRQDAGAVAHELGNSAGVLLRVYREIVSREDAERWVALVPPPATVPARKVPVR